MDNAYALQANVVDLLLDAVCVVDAQGRFVFVSAAFETIFGYAPAEVIGTQMIDLVHPDERARTLQAASEIMHGMPKRHFQNRYVRKDGRVVDIMWSARWLPDEGVRIAVARDVTELRRAEALQAATYAISEATNAAEDLPAMYRGIHDIVGRLLPAARFHIALYDDRRNVLSYPYHVDDAGPAPAPHALDAGSAIAGVIRGAQPLLITTADGDWLGVPLVVQQRVFGALVLQNHPSAVRYSEQDKELLHYVSTQVAAAIQRKRVEVQLQYVARYDQLTDLPNRDLLHDRLQTSLARARRDQTRLSLLYIDLDKFKQVNDTAGHVSGDLLLRDVAQRIKGCVRESDTVGRVGGDEFIALLGIIDHPSDAERIAEKIRAALDRPFDIGGQALRISCSVGIAVYPQHGTEYKQLIRHADQAMYGAKRQGGNRVRLAHRAQETPADVPTDG